MNDDKIKDIHARLRHKIDTLDGPIVLPNDVRIEVIECNGDAAELYKDAIDRASDEVSRLIAGKGLIQ